MKKHLLAAAVATAIAAPAMAQNVQIYGIVGVTQGYASAGTSAGRSFNTGNGAMSSSRFGVRGTEDLGGGLKASLKLEGSLAGDSGQVGGVGGASNAAPYTFDRDAFLSLGGGFGEVRIGRQESFVNATIAAVNPTGSNVAGAGYGGSGNNAYGTNVGTTGGSNNACGTGPQAIASRLNNNVRYISPVFSGFQADIGFVNGEAGAINGGSAQVGSGNTTQYGVTWSQGPVVIRAGAQEMKLAATTNKAKESIIGARYNAGDLSVGISFLETDPNTNNTNDRRKATSYSASYVLGGGVTTFGSYMTLSEDASANGGFGTSTAGKHEANAVVVGVKKDLSKRTNLFAIYGTVDNNQYGTYTLHSSAGMVSGVAGKDGKTALVGAQHSF